MQMRVGLEARHNAQGVSGSPQRHAASYMTTRQRLRAPSSGGCISHEIPAVASAHLCQTCDLSGHLHSGCELNTQMAAQSGCSSSLHLRARIESDRLSKSVPIPLGWRIPDVAACILSWMPSAGEAQKPIDDALTCECSSMQA